MKLLTIFISLFLISNLCSATTIDTPITLIQGRQYHLIPEILNMADGDVIPPEIYSEYDNRLIGASVVGRLHIKHEANADDPNPEFDYMKDALIQMEFSTQYLASIQKNGFLNQFQVNHSNGALNLYVRTLTENALAHVVLTQNQNSESPVNFLRPKYAFLTFTNNLDNQHRLISVTGLSYGNIIATMKDEVKYRSTFTTTDSAEMGNILSFSRLQAHTQTFFYRAHSAISYEYLGLVADYWEAQIWGALSLSDIDYLLINCPGVAASTPDQLGDLKKTGLPIYACKAAADKSHWAQGKLLIEGNPELVKKSRFPMSGSLTNQLSVDSKN